MNNSLRLGLGLSLGILLLVGCASGALEALRLGPNVSPETVSTLYQQQDVVVVDVREDGEYAAGHIPDAMLIPLGQMPDRLSEIPQSATVILVCRSGNRSSQARAFLTQQGFSNVHNMTGGMNAWARAGYEIEVCAYGEC